jgi:hypothetical protein
MLLIEEELKAMQAERRRNKYTRFSPTRQFTLLLPLLL